MTKPKATKKKDPKAKELVDELVKKDVDALRVRSKLTAGEGNVHCCGPMHEMP
jgi:hypothetical protein